MSYIKLSFTFLVVAILWETIASAEKYSKIDYDADDEFEGEYGSGITYSQAAGSSGNSRGQVVYTDRKVYGGDKGGSHKGGFKKGKGEYYENYQKEVPRYKPPKEHYYEPPKMHYEPPKQKPSFNCYDSCGNGCIYEKCKDGCYSGCGQNCGYSSPKHYNSGGYGGKYFGGGGYGGYGGQGWGKHW